jgi:hypothetical protein
MRIGGNAESRLTAAVLCLGIVVTVFFSKPELINEKFKIS